MEKRIPLTTKNNIYFVIPDDILYCKCNNTSTTFYLRNQPEITISKGMKVVEKLLDGNNFIRPHQSYLVNQNHIVMVDKTDNYTLVLSNNQRLPSAIRRRKEMMDLLKVG
ncbi:MAG: hypothetical protein DRI74_06725 [Bacteroidetes bacterium]|nr:MAG: hypothetical protein DRI74_06725 [Bacteroidota bacterium]